MNFLILASWLNINTVQNEINYVYYIYNSVHQCELLKCMVILTLYVFYVETFNYMSRLQIIIVRIK